MSPQELLASIKSLLKTSVLGDLIDVKKLEKYMNNDRGFIDCGTHYEMVGYEPKVTFNEHGQITSMIYCPYVPKFLVDGK